MTRAQPTGPEVDSLFMMDESGQKHLPPISIRTVRISILSISIPKTDIIFAIISASQALEIYLLIMLGRYDDFHPLGQ